MKLKRNEKNVKAVILLFKNHGENKTGRLVPDIFFFFAKALYKIK